MDNDGMFGTYLKCILRTTALAGRNPDDKRTGQFGRARGPARQPRSATILVPCPNLC